MCSCVSIRKSAGIKELGGSNMRDRFENLYLHLESRSRVESLPGIFLSFTHVYCIVYLSECALSKLSTKDVDRALFRGKRLARPCRALVAAEADIFDWRESSLPVRCIRPQVRLVLGLASLVGR